MSIPTLIRAACCLGLMANIASAADAGYHKEVTVSEPTRLDWTFVVSNQSVVDPPAEWLRGYDSRQQRYELFVPPGKPKNDGWPMVLFISAGDSPLGWKQWESVCKQKGVVFASPYGAGNNTSMPRRVRTILDVLDDVRRQHRIDPDRTYIAGFSGGARVCCAVAFALPELFGGAIQVCAAGELREEPWLRHRAIDRLGFLFVTGTDDFNYGEIEQFKEPMFKGMGIRTEVIELAKMGHEMPGAYTFQKAIDWLDSGTADRRKLAARYPAMHTPGDQAPSREEQAKALLAEGQAKIKDRKTMFAGLMLLQGVMTRWPDLSAADSAKKILVEYEAKADKPWEADDIAEQRKFLIARVRALDAYASGPLPDQYIQQRADMAKAAIQLWEAVIEDGGDVKAVNEGKRRIVALKKLIQE